MAKIISNLKKFLSSRKDYQTDDILKIAYAVLGEVFTGLALYFRGNYKLPLAFLSRGIFCCC